MSNRLLTRAERATLKELKARSDFEHDLIRRILRRRCYGTQTVSESIVNNRDNPGGFVWTPERTKQYFLEESEHWAEQGLTEEEFDYAWKKAFTGKVR